MGQDESRCFERLFTYVVNNFRECRFDPMRHRWWQWAKRIEVLECLVLNFDETGPQKDAEPKLGCWILDLFWPFARHSK